jgi:hypothetical protein
MTPGVIKRTRSLWCAAALVCCTHLGSLPAAEAQTATLARLAEMAGPAELIQVESGRLYIVADRALRIVDVTHPAAPKPVGTFVFPERVRAFAVAGAHLYVLADFYGMRILDVSNPAAPVLRGGLALKGGYFSIAVFDATTILASGVLAGLQAIDVSDRTKPAARGSYFTDGYAQAIVSARPFAYVIDDPTGLYVFDLSNPGAPTVETIVELTDPSVPEQGTLTNLAIALSAPAVNVSPVLLVLSKTTGLLLVYDVSNAREPVRKGTLRLSPGAESLVVRGSRAYIGRGSAGLETVDFSNPSQPISTGVVTNLGTVRELAVSGSQVFVATGQSVLVLGQK